MLIVTLRSFIIALSVACALVACKPAVEDRIDTTGFSATACPAGATSPFPGLTSTQPFDYLALELTDGTTAGALGTPCAGATAPATCEANLDEAISLASSLNETWPSSPAGGAEPPAAFLVMTYGDTVKTIGRSELTAFLSPVESAPNAAFLAEVATEGTADCAGPAAKQVAGKKK